MISSFLCLIIFFGVPLLDQTNTLHGAIQVDVVLVRSSTPPPHTHAAEEVDEYKILSSCCLRDGRSNDDGDGDGGEDYIAMGSHAEALV